MSLVRGFDPQAQQLLAHVRSGANPDARLALAAHLRTSDAADEHAELIVLTQQLGLSPDTSRARRCLDLLSSIGLGWLDNDDEACIGPARGGGCYPVQYELTVDSFLYYVRYRHGGLSISDAIEMMVHFYDNDYPCLRDRTQAAGGAWTDEETNVLLFEISNALRMQKPHQQLPPDWQVHPHDQPIAQLVLNLPHGESMRNHPRFRKGPYPRYAVPSCGQRHAHNMSCSNWMVRASDLDFFNSIAELVSP